MTAFHNLGHFYANEQGQCRQLLRLKDADGVFQPFLEWGYAKRPAPNAGSYTETESVFDPAYGVPEHARAVRIHIKAKAKTIQWAANGPIADIQVGVKERGVAVSSNECTHAYSMKRAEYDYTLVDGAIVKTAANPTTSTEPPTEDINSITVDVEIGPEGLIDIYHHPTVIRSYANLDLIAYLAGYWA